MTRAPLGRLYRAAHLALLGAIAVLLAAIYAKLPDRAPTVGELRAAASAKRGAAADAVLDRMPLVRVHSGEVSVDRVESVGDVESPVQVEGPVDVEATGDPLPVTVER